jgi:hypothetical protein
MAKDATTEPKDGRSRGRGVSFRFDDELFVSLWAQHNNGYKDSHTASMDSEALFTAFRDFCILVFCAHTSADQAEECGCKRMEHNSLDKWKGHTKLGGLWDKNGKIVGNMFDRGDIIYNYMYEKVMRKVDQLLPKIVAYNNAVTEPVGMSKAGYMWSEERTLNNFAAKFHN